MSTTFLSIIAQLIKEENRVSMILVKEAAPDASSLGATNGLCQFFMVCSNHTYFRRTISTHPVP